MRWTPLVLTILLLPGGAGLFAQPDLRECSHPGTAFGGAAGTPIVLVDAIQVSTEIILGDLDVGVDIRHPWIGDLMIDVSSPGGTTLHLHDGEGGTADDIRLTWSDQGLPNGAAPYDLLCAMQASPGPGLGAFTGESTLGEWTLSLVDTFPDSADGVLVRWCLLAYESIPAGSPAVENLACLPGATPGTAEVSWMSPVPFAAFDLFIDGIWVETLDGAATGATTPVLSSSATVEICVAASVPGGSPSCQVCCTVLVSAPVDVEVCSTPQLPISGSLPPAVDAVSVTSPLLVGNVEIPIAITHPSILDLTVDLQSPSGTTVRLHDAVGGFADDLDLILSDAGVASVLGPFDCACFKRPTGPGTLADFSYEPAGGTWTLTASDGFPADDGVLESWCLRIDGADCQLPPPVALGCSESGGDVLLAWTNPESYDSLELRRDGALVATLPGGATSAIDPAVPPGPHRYAVAGVSDALGCESPSRECALVTGLVAYQTERVVLVLIDGMRYSEGLGDPLREHVPQMDLLSQQGAIIEPFINDGFTNTARAIPAIWSGAWTGIETFEDYHCEGAANRASVLPTIFEYYRRQLGRPAVECVQMVGSLGGGCPWRSSFHSDYGTEFWPAVFQEGASDLEIFSHFEEVLESLQPRLLYFYLPDVDHAGHSGVWDDYLAAIETADSVVGMLWAAIEANPEYAGVTTMLVTNDHGRHSYDFTGHGDGCDGCRTIELLAVGPDIVPGLVSEVPRTLRDIAPTIGALLGFVTEHSTGEVMTEILLSGPLLRRGDVDGDGLILLNDSILILFYLFAGGAAACVDAADIDDDGQVLIGDAILHLGHLFAGGPPPAPPFPGCGIDPSPDAGADLGCEGPVVGCQ